MKQRAKPLYRKRGAQFRVGKIKVRGKYWGAVAPAGRKRLSEERKAFYAAGKERRGRREGQQSAGSKTRAEFG